MSACAKSHSNPVVWRERLHKTTASQFTALTVVNAIGAAALIGFLHDRLVLENNGLLPGWGWWSLAALMAGTAYFSFTRVRRERSRGTLELLRSTPLVPGALLQAQVQLSLGWMARAIPLWALWVLWIVAAGTGVGYLRLAIVVPFSLMIGVAGALVGVRLALSPQGSNWAALGGAVALASVIAIPALIDTTTGFLQQADSDAVGLGSWNAVGEGSILAFLALGLAWLWNANMRSLSGYELINTTSRSTQVAPLWETFDRALLWVTSLVGLQKNPFFMRERARSLRRLTREPAIVLTAVVPTLVPWVVSRVLTLSLGVSLAWCSIPLIFLWWMAGAEMTRNSMTNELDGRTLDSVRVSPLSIDTVLRGTVLGRMYPFVIGWLVSLPLWAGYAIQPGISALSVMTFAVVLLGVGFSSAVGGLRGSCNSLGLKGEERHYSQAVSNPGLWAWPLFTPLAYLFIVLPFHPLLEATHLASAYNTWIPMDILTLFPTWFVLPGLLPATTFLLGVLLHGIILTAAVRKDLEAAWDAVYNVMHEDLPEEHGDHDGGLIQAVVFDWDGVLVDSEPVFKKVEQALLLQAWEASGQPGNPATIHERIHELIRDMSGMGARAALGMCHARLGLTGSLDDLLTGYRQRIQAVYGTSPLLPRALETVQRLRPHVRLAVATSSPHALVDALVEQTGIAPLLDALVTVDDVGGVAKPAPDVYLSAARQLGLDPAVCVAIEDTTVGCESARTAGFRVLAIPRRETVFASFKAAHRVLRSLSDLTLEFLGELDRPPDPAEADLVVALYARATQGRRADVLLHLQTVAAAAMAADRGWTVTASFQDEDDGGCWWDRPGLKSLLDLAQQHAIQRVVIAEPSVLASGALEQAEIVRRLADSAVRVRHVFRKEPYARTGTFWN